MSDQEIRAHALRDQAWTDIRQYEDCIQLMATEDGADAAFAYPELVRKMALVVLAEICMRDAGSVT